MEREGRTYWKGREEWNGKGGKNLLERERGMEWKSQGLPDSWMERSGRESKGDSSNQRCTFRIASGALFSAVAD